MLYLTIELGFFYANVIKFFDGGWLTIVLGGFIAVCMYAWYNGRLIKAKFIKFVKLDKYVSIIKELKLDETISCFHQFGMLEINNYDKTQNHESLLCL